MFGYKYAAVMSDGVIFASDSLRTVYHKAESHRRYAMTQEDAGQRGYTLTKDEKPFYGTKSGEDVTIQEAEVSVRLYNTLIRHALRNHLVSENVRDVTWGQVRSWLIGEELHHIRNAGVKTYLELFENLWRYTGWSATMQRAFNEHMKILPTGKAWVNKRPTMAR